MTDLGARKAGRIERFFEQHLTLTKDRFAGQSFVLEPWQREGIIRPIFGTLTADGRRRYTDVLIGLPRWQGKTEIAAGIVAACMFTEPVPGGEYYVVATTRQQAGIAFKAVKGMVQRDPILAAASKVYRNIIEIPEVGAEFRTMPWDADTAQGFHPTVAVIDEYHVHRDASMREAMLTGMVGSQSGLLVTITTAGKARRGPLWDLLQERKPRNRYVEWIGAGEGEDATDHKVWRAANPASWITMPMLKKAYGDVPLPVFERLHLNRFPQAEGIDAVFAANVWDACRQQPADRGGKLVIAVDSAMRRDHVAVIADERDGDGVHNIEATIFTGEGMMSHHDYDSIEETIRAYWRTGRVDRIIADPAFFGRSMALLEDEGLPIEEFPQTNERMCAAAQSLYEAVVAGRMRHGGHRLLREHALNAVVIERPPWGWRIGKASNDEKIDGIIATAMAVHIAEQQHLGTSVYESRGLLNIHDSVTEG